jgi:hypothetical protein
VPIDESVNYGELAKALLKRGDTPRSVIAFLRADYGLDIEEAKATLIAARTLPKETRRTPPHRTPRNAQTRSKV